MKKIAIVIEGGMVKEVYADDPYGYDVEIIDLDTLKEDAAMNRLNTVQQYLPNVYRK